MKRFQTVVSGVIISLFFISSAVSARTVEEVYKECGIGGHLFGNSSPTLAFISNVTWDLGTTAAISDATNACATTASTAAIYIHEAFDLLEQDIAMGDGEYLNGLVSIMDCDQSTSVAMKQELRAEFATIVNTESYATMTKMQKSQMVFNFVEPRLAAAAVSACQVS